MPGLPPLAAYVSPKTPGLRLKPRRSGLPKPVVGLRLAPSIRGVRCQVLALQMAPISPSSDRLCHRPLQEVSAAVIAKLLGYSRHERLSTFVHHALFRHCRRILLLLEHRMVSLISVGAVRHFNAMFRTLNTPTNSQFRAPLSGCLVTDVTKHSPVPVSGNPDADVVAWADLVSYLSPEDGTGQSELARQELEALLRQAKPSLAKARGRPARPALGARYSLS